MHLLYLLGHPIRWRIVEILASGEHTAGEVCGAIVDERRVERTAVSYHLTVLVEAEVITARPSWSSIVYRLHPRLIGALALITQGLIEKRDGARYDDIVLRDDVDAIHESLLRPDARLAECWCIRKISVVRNI
ncbi:ArsR/SmtB family transcription factor [Microcella sp.]|uniref:ArsR/SmtB family transcription factor n=1 Tax=Microcella sp. TaxID=1913979 RepID=UPI00391B748F